MERDTQDETHSLGHVDEFKRCPFSSYVSTLSGHSNSYLRVTCFPPKYLICLRRKNDQNEMETGKKRSEKGVGVGPASPTQDKLSSLRASVLLVFLNSILPSG